MGPVYTPWAALAALGHPEDAHGITLAVNSEPEHIPVLIDEVLGVLDPQPGEVFLDCTAGLGGHAAAVAARLAAVAVGGQAGTVMLNDADPANVARAAARVRAVVGDRVSVIELQGNFAEAPRRLAEKGLAADLVLADLGFASSQMADPARGLSFQREGPLDMRFDPASPFSAAELVATLPEEELARILYEFGEERASRRIARKLVEARRSGPISTTGELAELVRAALGRKPGRGGTGGGKTGAGRRGGRTIDPATKTFQALRIAVNDELGSLNSLLESIRRGAEQAGRGVRVEKRGGRGPEWQGEGQRGALQDAREESQHDNSKDVWLRPGARVAIISFHSLEDRPVKRCFAELAAREPRLAERLTRKAVTAGEDEVQRNARSRSAKLRAVRIAPE